jgi:hypothetical protein
MSISNSQRQNQRELCRVSSGDGPRRASAESHSLVSAVSPPAPAGMNDTDLPEICSIVLADYESHSTHHGPRATGRAGGGGSRSGIGERRRRSLAVRAARRGRCAPVYRLRIERRRRPTRGRRARQPRNSRAWELGPAGPTRRDERQRRRPERAQLGAHSP